MGRRRMLPSRDTPVRAAASRNARLNRDDGTGPLSSNRCQGAPR